ncbi:sigma-54-dependent Fis family transcriptional regulator [Paraburkholderia sp. JPY432]|uniref:sigma-54 interaction domain-containing protein n=1 Tax=Paraburkholderia youngii TaxID=2782701 RepID=UPI00159619B5|nr:sigma-54 dependent transcriptional regulator [Paraburkholderia youngii]NVH74214.1 sigma-54-dependent Fis family transcriptional regulator [Paraburkholderia youngii]
MLNPCERFVITADAADAKLAARIGACVRECAPAWQGSTLPAGAISGADAAVFILICSPTNYPSVRDDISEARQARPHAQILIVARDLSWNQVGALLACGAFDFISNTFEDDEFAMRFRRAAGLLISAAPSSGSRRFFAHAPDLVGDSPAFMKALSDLALIAGCDADVLLLGETGTGKEVCARAVHYQSSRASRPWVAVNCGSIPTDLVESELFGHVRGAFTNAHVDRSGLVREAEGGTLFLDEIDAMPLNAQCKLLRFLQDKQFREVGSSTARQAHVRVIAASNRNLRELAASGQFRQDLFFRLSVLELTLPALRERRGDIPILVAYFLDDLGRRTHRAGVCCAPDALRKLADYVWPGNVRELRHVLERAALMCPRQVLRADDIKVASASPPDSGDAEATSFRAAKARVVESFERAYLERMLAQSRGNITRAALAAQKDRRAFFELMRKHGIEPDTFRATD